LKIQTFIIVHSVQLIINNYLKFTENCLDGEIIYMLVGINHDTTILKDLSIKVIHCETIPGNIEEKKNLLHLTALHIINQEKLINDDTDYIRILEYDFIFSKDYIKNCNRVLAMNKQYYTHTLITMKTCWFNPKLSWLHDINEKAYKELFNTSISLLSRKSKSMKWCCSINYICSKKFYDEFWNYYLKFEPYYKDAKHAGNLLERLYTLYCLHKDIEYIEIPGGSRNAFKNSHGTS